MQPLPIHSVRHLLGPLLLVATAVLAAVPVLLLEADQERQEVKEPPLRVEVEIGGQTIAAEDGKPFELDIEGRKVQAVVRVAETRLAMLPGLRFEYPLNMAFEHDDSDPAVTVWTFDGNYTVLMLFEYADGQNINQMADAYREGVIAELGEMAEPGDRVKVKVAGTEYVGQRVLIEVAGAPLVQDVFPVPAGNGRGYVMVLQDQDGEDGQYSQETQTLLEHIDRSWETPDAE